jgi:hypothetical protein
VSFSLKKYCGGAWTDTSGTICTQQIIDAVYVSEHTCQVAHGAAATPSYSVCRQLLTRCTTYIMNSDNCHDAHLAAFRNQLSNIVQLCSAYPKHSRERIK